jgi:glycosyltransferase involved in cell wall biosynthesis
MRILQLFNRFPWPLKDGGALVNFNMLQGYYANGCRVTAAVLNTSKHHVDFNALPDTIKNLADFNLVDIDNRIKITDAFFNLFSKKSYHVTRFISKDFSQLLIKLCQQNTFDVVVFESIFMAPYLHLIRQHTKAVCILRSHNVEFEIWQTQSKIAQNPLKKWYLNLLANRLKNFETGMLNKFDGIVTITQNDSQRFAQLGCHKPMHVAPAGIPVSSFKGFEPTDNVSFFHLGSMDWMPNQEAILWFVNEVWPIIYKKYPHITFTIAGRNMPDAFFKLNKLGVNVVGEVPNALEFMQQHGVMIVPLFSGSGMRVKIIEGMAMAKCIIATPLGAQGIEAIPNKEIIIAKEKTDFVNAITQLIEKPQLIGQIGSAAQRLVQHKYNIDLIIQQTLTFYKGLIHNQHE